MSWIQKLYETYELCSVAPQFESEPLLPVSHTEQQAHVEIVLDQLGNFLRASLLQKETTVVPATEASAGRTGKRPPPHPLCDKIQYCASDYKAFGGTKEPFFAEYLAQLQEWARYAANPKIGAVLNYIEKGSVVADLVREGVLHSGPDGKLITDWQADGPVPGILKVLTPKDGSRDQGDAFVRWRVQVPGDPVSALWMDPAVRLGWTRFVNDHAASRGLCMVSGSVAPLAASHPKRLRHGADGAKLISSNDENGYTFRGRLATASQAYGLSADISQKAHSALRWLLARQGYKSGEQAFVAWAVSGKTIPDPLADTAALFGAAPADAQTNSAVYEGDAGQHFALRLKKAIAGFRANLGDADQIVVIGLDSATPGRMAIVYYRELLGGEFLSRVMEWHARCSWAQSYSASNKFFGAPAPRDIAEAAYGRRLDDKLRNSTVERLLPCIIDARPIPGDIVDSVVRRACNRAGAKEWEWEKGLGIACALYRGSQRKDTDYRMALEEDRTTRDYLFGRLLAIAENIEQRALHLGGETRDTGAGRLMQRFADRPCSTWKTIECALGPYKARLRARRPAVLLERDKLLDRVMGLFVAGDFTSDSKLSGEFLLGYHCQRAALWSTGKPEEGQKDDDNSEAEG